MKQEKHKGYVLFESPHVVAIATMESSNRKTGNMVQTWILNRNMLPTEAVNTGADSAVCFDCPLRGDNGKGRVCYVNTGQAPQGIYRAYKAGRYPRLTDPAVFKGRKLRLGAYGDPAAVPTAVWQSILERAAGWTGYTHQWRKPWAQGLKPYVMASCDSVYDQCEASKAGWRTFRARKSGQPMLADEIDCPADRVTCDRCGLCKGASIKAKNISIPVHGTGAGYFN